MNPTLGRGSGGSGGPTGYSSPLASNNGGNILGLRTAPTFGGAFEAQAGSSAGIVYPYLVLGNAPAAGNTTNIPTYIDEVSWTLLNENGSVFKTVEFAPFETLTLSSPNFQDASYSSSPSPTQFADAVQRAEFYQSLIPSWHTRLVPSVVHRVNITVPYHVSVQFSNGSIIQARTYFTGTAADGSTFVLMLDLLFDFFFDNEAVSQLVSGAFQADGINIAAFPNTFLFSLNLNNPNVPGGCCVLGFHTYFLEVGAQPQPRWLTVYESWISPGLFGSDFRDVTALSHEVSETFNDPFLNNLTPSWQFPGQPPTSTVCQGNLETGDPIEVLANATYPISLPVNGGPPYTFHPQNEALVPWFAMGASNALGGAFSYPNTTVLPQAAIPCPVIK